MACSRAQISKYSCLLFDAEQAGNNACVHQQDGACAASSSTVPAARVADQRSRNHCSDSENDIPNAESCGIRHKVQQRKLGSALLTREQPVGGRASTAVLKALCSMLRIISC